MDPATSGNESSRNQFAVLLSNLSLDWTRVLAYLGEHLITPSFYLSIVANGEQSKLEQSVHEALRFIYDANLQRNQEILAAFKQFCSVLNDIGVYPTPLKGVAFLLDEIYPDVGERMVTDIDVLINAGDLHRVLVALSDAGYLQVSNQLDPINLHLTCDFFPINVDDFRNQQAHFDNQENHFDNHIPPVQAANSRIKIDIHTLVSQRNDRASRRLNELAIQNADLITHDLGSMQRASRLFHLLHNFYHSQVQHEFAKLELVDYRHLIDIKFLLKSISAEGATSGHPEKLIAEAARIASECGLAKEFALYSSQLAEYCGVKFGNEILAPQPTPTNDTFVTSHPLNRVRRFFTSLLLGFRRLSGVLNVSKWLRARYGPIPIGTALYKYFRFLWFRIARLVLEKTKKEQQ